jgi:phosphoribosyl-AMP cyclohydrolase
MGLILGLWRERFYNRLRGWPEHVRLISSYNEIREATLFSRKKKRIWVSGRAHHQVSAYLELIVCSRDLLKFVGRRSLMSHHTGK